MIELEFTKVEWLDHSALVQQQKSRMAADLVVERIQSDLVLVTFGIMLWLLVVVMVVMMVEVLMLRLLLLLLLTLLLLLQEGVIKVEVL